MNDSLKDALQLLLAGLGIVSYYVIIVVELCSTPRFQLITNFRTAPAAEVEVGSFIIGTVAWIIFALMRKRTTRSTRPIDSEARRPERNVSLAWKCAENTLDFQPQIGRILQKLQQVRRAKKPSFGDSPAEKCLSFGFEAHQFLLAEPIGEEAILSFEKQHGIRLPEDYRQFLMFAGSSGAGPSYGILPLDKWAEATWDALPADYLARPCPLAPGTKAKLSANASSETGIDPWDELLQGSIALVSQGCSYYAILIVSGPSRGRVAYLSMCDPESVYFPENLNFLSWYERWLDELLAGHDTSWFGYGALGTEEELALRLKDPALPAEDKSAAIRTLMRINPLTRSSMKILSAYSKDTSGAPTPRAAAASLFISRSDDAAYVRLLLQDSCAEVRKKVLLAVSRKGSPLLADAVGNLVDDPDSTVAHEALLHGKGILTRNEIAPFLKSENVDLRRAAIYSLGGAPDASVEELVALASHENDQSCRIYAIQALRDLKNRAARAPLEQLLKRETDDLIRMNIVRALAILDDATYFSARRFLRALGAYFAGKH